jgi:hypothetical protein
MKAAIRRPMNVSNTDFYYPSVLVSFGEEGYRKQTGFFVLSILLYLLI